ncbi:MAG: lamin tail domain-containing protein [Halolamina sp.]
MRASVTLSLVTLVLFVGCLGAVQTTTPAPESPATPPGNSVPLSATPPRPDAGLTATVVEVIDGDTVGVEFENGTRDTVRLLGVDTPEVHAATDPTEFEGVPNTEAGADCLRRAGERASEYTSDRLLGAEVTLTFDANEPRRGYYDRLLAYLFVDGTEFNYALVADGYGRVYDSEFVRRQRYYRAESAAMDAGRGLWECRTAGNATTTATPTTTETESETTATRTDGGTAAEPGAAVRVETVHADAEGRDGENLTDEFVVLENAGDEPVDLSGWTVADDDGHSYAVPDGVVLGSGERLRIRTGAGEDGSGDLYWSRAGPVWNNDGDTVIVRDADGDVVLRETYG